MSNDNTNNKNPPLMLEATWNRKTGVFKFWVEEVGFSEPRYRLETTRATSVRLARYLRDRYGVKNQRIAVV